MILFSHSVRTRPFSAIDMHSNNYTTLYDGGLVDIEKEDTPYFQYLNSQTIPRTFHALDPAIPTPATSQLKSKNSIFDVCHVINKPASKMTAEEFLQLKSGGLFVGTSPASSTHVADIQPMTEWVAIQDYTSNVINTNNKDKVTEMKNETREIMNPHQNITHPMHFDSIHLCFLPTRKRKLGEGRYSNVYFANCSSSSKPKSTDFYPCACKRLHSSMEAQSQGLSEAIVLRHLEGVPNIITLLEVKDENDAESKGSKKERFNATMKGLLADSSPTLLLVLEYLPKGNLWEYIERNGKLIDWRIWLKWAREMSGALEAIHSKGIVHHDLKPHNIMVI